MIQSSFLHDLENPSCGVVSVNHSRSYGNRLVPNVRHVESKQSAALRERCGWRLPVRWEALLWSGVRHPGLSYPPRWMPGDYTRRLTSSSLLFRTQLNRGCAHREKVSQCIVLLFYFSLQS